MLPGPPVGRATARGTLPARGHPLPRGDPRAVASVHQCRGRASHLHWADPRYIRSTAPPPGLGSPSRNPPPAHPSPVPGLVGSEASACRWPLSLSLFSVCFSCPEVGGTQPGPEPPGASGPSEERTGENPPTPPGQGLHPLYFLPRTRARTSFFSRIQNWKLSCSALNESEVTCPRFPLRMHTGSCGIIASREAYLVPSLRPSPYK